MIQTFIIFFAAVVLAAIISVTVACYQVTRTVDVFHFVCDYKYWCFAILNYQYRKSICASLDTHAFIKQFSEKYIVRRNLRRLFPMKEKDRILFISILSNIEFLKENFGDDRFSYSVFKALWVKWMQYVKDNGIKNQEDAQ